MSIQYYHIDAKTIRQIADGDEAAFKTLFVGYHKQVFRMAWKIFRSKEAAEDIAQEVLLRLWSERQKLETIEKLGAYINTMAANLIYNRLRRGAIENQYLVELVKEQGANPFEEGEENRLREMQRHVHYAIDRLSPQQKKIFLMSRAEGLKYEQIAASLNISHSTVKFHIKEALKSIRKYMKANDLMIAFFFIDFFIN